MNNKCPKCKGTGENHYHDEDGKCHLKCEYCLGTGEQRPIEERYF